MTLDHRDPLDVALDWLLQVQQNPDDGVLRERLAHWLASDELHLTAYRQAERAWRVSGLLAPAGAVTPVASAPRIPVRPRRRNRRVWQLAGALAACFAVVGLHQDLYLAWRADYRTADGERRVFHLPDGSSVTLNAHSAIAFDFASGRRDVSLLAGQAYFQVAKDTEHPFRVSTGELAITVTGTAFNVDYARARVSVAEGAVRVAVGDSEVSLSPGLGVQLNSVGILEARNEPAQQVAAWRQGRLILRQERIADVLEALRPYSSGVLVLRDTELGEQRVTGVYDLDDPQRVLRAILLAHGGGLTQLGPLTLIDRN